VKLRLNQSSEFVTIRPGPPWLVLSGTIEQVIVNIEGWFNPHAIAILGDWEVAPTDPLVNIDGGA